MTPEEILKDLRGIHLPLTAETATAPGFSAAPFLILALVALIAAAAIWRRRNHWRRSAAARLQNAGMAGSPSVAWAQMLVLLGDLARIGRAGAPPSCAHLPPERVGPEECERLRRHLSGVIKGRANG